MTRLTRLTRLVIAAAVLAGADAGGACTAPAPSEQPAPAPDAPSAEQTPASALRLYVFNCGHIRFETLEAFSIEDDETDVRELIVPCYVVEHPDGRMLWDGGLPSSTAEADGWQGNNRLDQTLASQLAEVDLGFDLSSLDYVAFSHMHYDHVGVANEIEGATWLVQGPEYEAMFGGASDVPAAQSELYENMRDAERIILDGDHDVFGDGRVRILSAPGHTPGHQVLFLDLADTGPLVLSGDLYHFRLSRADRRVPTFNSDREETLASMDRIEAFVEEVGATFWIEHDLALFEELDKVPAYYE